MPTFPAGTRNFKEQSKRLSFLQSAREEMSKISAEMRICKALRAKFPPASHLDLHIGQHVRVFRKQNLKWEGPFHITHISTKEMWITNGNKRAHFSNIQILPEWQDDADRELKHLLQGFRHFNSGGIPCVSLTENLHPADP